MFPIGSADRTTCIWTFNGKLLSTLIGHYDALSGIEFHPSGRFLVTSSFDQTWSLWDLEKALAITKTIGSHGKNPLFEQARINSENEKYHAIFAVSNLSYQLIDGFLIFNSLSIIFICHFLTF